MPISNADQASQSGTKATRIRYQVLLLGFLMAFMMYMGRGAIGAENSAIMKDFKVDKITMGWSLSAFNWSYALFQIPGGWMADLFGPRIVLGIAMAWWAIFMGATGLTVGAPSLAAARFLLGMGEAAGFPAGSRALVRWLPKRQRAFGQGFQHSGSRFGAAIAPPLVVMLMARMSWRSICFYFGAVGIVWAIGWYAYYRDSPDGHPKVNAQEVELLADAAPRVQSGVKPAVPWRRILGSPDVRYISTIYFCYGFVLWMYLTWFPTYLLEARHFSAAKTGLAAMLPLLAATTTNVAGGVLSDRLAHRWNDLRRGRLVVSMCGFAIAGLALLPGVLSSSTTIALICLTIALAGLELTVAISWVMCIDIGGEFSGSVSSVMNTSGQIGGALSAIAVGYLATMFGWTSPFLVGSFLCLLAAFLVSRVDPRRSVV